MEILKSDPVFRYFTNDLNFEYCNFWGEGVKEIDPELEEEKKLMLCLCVSIHFFKKGKDFFANNREVATDFDF